MKRRVFARPRSLLLALALAVVATLCTVSTARAASSAPGVGNAAGGRIAASSSAAVSDQPCNFVYSIKTCESTDPTVSMSGYYYGDTSACTFVWNIYWGDGASSTDIMQTDPTDGYHFLASHTYAAPGTYTITDSTQVTAGTCTASNGDHTFTLLASPPPASSPKIHWNRTSSLPGRLVTLTGSGWVPGGIVQVHLPEKALFIGISSWRVNSQGNWKESFAVGDAPQGKYKLSFSETSGRLLVTSSFTVLDQPNLLERFSGWIDACLSGQLKSDPTCKDELLLQTHLKISATTVLSCVTDLREGASGIATCIIELGAAVGYLVYTTWQSWWAHKPGP
jgi:hypothetical protein